MNGLNFSTVLKKIGGKYYSPRGKSIYDSILIMKSKNFKKFTLGGCFIEKISETVFISREK